MVARTRTKAELAERDDHMGYADDFALQICREAEQRGLGAYQVAAAIASVLAGRNPTLAGKVLYSVRDAIRANFPLIEGPHGPAH